MAINTPSLEELIALYKNQGANVDVPAIGDRAVKGLELQDTILKNKQAQEDRTKKLSDEIANMKRERAYQLRASNANPNIANEIGFIPKESAESILKANLAAQSDEAKLARANLRGQAPDKIKQLFQVGDKVMGVTYGGEVKPINAPGELHPLNKTLPAEQVEKTAGFSSMQDLIGRVKADAIDPRTNNISEATKGRLGLGDVALEKAKSYVPGFGDPKSTGLYQKYQDIQNQIVYLRSGKQINEAEAKRLSEAMPSIYKQDTFASDMANFERTFAQIAAQRQAEFKRTGYYIPEEAGTPVIPGNAPSATPTGIPGQTGGLSPEKAARLAELRAKKAAGTLR